MSDHPATRTTDPDLRDEAENLSQWMVFLGEQAKDIPRLVRAAGVMRDLIAEVGQLIAEVRQLRAEVKRHSGHVVEAWARAIRCPRHLPHRGCARKSDMACTCRAAVASYWPEYAND